MTRRALMVAVLLGAVAGVGVIGSGVLQGSETGPKGHTGSRLGRMAGPAGFRDEPASGPGRQIGPTDPRTRVDFSFALRMPRQRAFRRFVAAVQDPRSPLFHHFIDAATIGRRYGLSARRVARLTRQLAAAGVHVTAAYPQHTTLQVSAAAGAIDRLLGVSLADFRDTLGRRYHRPLKPAVIPAGLRDALTATAGLNNRRLKLTSAVPAGGLKPNDAALAYDVGPLHQMGLNGQGQTIAIVSRGTFQDSDIQGFDQATGITGAPPVQRVQVGPNPVSYTPDPNSASAEVSLDIDIIRGLAPQAQIINYESASTGEDVYAAVVDKIVADGKTTLVNISYGDCEAHSSGGPAALQQFDQSFAAAVAHNVTIFVAAGDSGAYTCQHSEPANQTIGVAFPASSPNVVSVGGTYLDVKTDGTYLGEAGWENVLSIGGGGGGNSSVFPRPSWQAGVNGLDNQFTANPPMRQLPDVAATADPATGYFLYTGGQAQQIGGTSAAAPFWTGSMALVNQLAQSQQINLGFLAPVLYKAAAQQPSAFHDVVLGGNRYHTATPGWDFATGLGSPDVSVLAHAILTQLGGH